MLRAKRKKKMREREKNRMSFGAYTWAGARPDLVWQGTSHQTWHRTVHTYTKQVCVSRGGAYREGGLQWPSETQWERDREE